MALRLRGQEVTTPDELLKELSFRAQDADELTSSGEMGKTSTAAFEATREWLSEFVMKLEAAGVKNFLRFITGLSSVKATSTGEQTPIIVHVYHDPVGNTPTASTCTRTMLLPAYQSRADFEKKLNWSLEEFRVRSSQIGGAEMGWQ